MRRSDDWPRELHAAVDGALGNRGHDLAVGR
jgi:hypothetical protein